MCEVKYPITTCKSDRENNDFVLVKNADKKLNCHLSNKIVTNSINDYSYHSN
jgi:hypothetical protein